MACARPNTDARDPADNAFAAPPEPAGANHVQIYLLPRREHSLRRPMTRSPRIATQREGTSTSRLGRRSLISEGFGHEWSGSRRSAMRTRSKRNARRRAPAAHADSRQRNPTTSRAHGQWHSVLFALEEFALAYARPDRTRLESVPVRNRGSTNLARSEKIRRFRATPARIILTTGSCRPELDPPRPLARVAYHGTLKTQKRPSGAARILAGGDGACLRAGGLPNARNTPVARGFSTLPLALEALSVV